ncbi:MAG TPA: hypothetical protein VFI03_09725 [Solirubrobacterales bacterium]|nr:hypothetical protein [Solirubrobacterales bacterium]
MAVLAALAAVTLVVSAVPAGAGAEALAGGTTRIELNRALFSELKRDRVKVEKIGTGTVGGRSVDLPVSGGSVDVGTAIGSIAFAGGFKFRTGKRVVRLNELLLDTQKGELNALLNGKRLQIASLMPFQSSRAGFGDEIDVAALKLNKQASALLNRKLGLTNVFRPKRAFASLASNVQPQAIRMAGGEMQFSLDPGTVAKLKSLGVDPVSFETATLGAEPPAYSAPLIQGEIYPAESRSWGFLEGGIRLARPAPPEPPETPGPIITFPVITLINLGLSLETQKLLGYVHVHDEAAQPAPAPAGPIAALDFSGATVQLDPLTRTLSIANVRATLEAPFANLINETFATPKGKAPVLAAGDPLGTFSLTMQSR